MYRKSQKVIAQFYLKDNFEQDDIEKICMLAGSHNASTRRDVAVLLGTCYDAKGEKTLYHLTFDKADIVKIEAVDSLANGSSHLTLQRLNQVIHDENPYLRLYGIQSLTDVFFNRNGLGDAQKKKLLRHLSAFEAEEYDELVLAAIQKCKAVCGDFDAAVKLINIHQFAKANHNYHLISPVGNMLNELIFLEHHQKVKDIVTEYLKREIIA